MLKNNFTYIIVYFILKNNYSLLITIFLKIFKPNISLLNNKTPCNTLLHNFC